MAPLAPLYLVAGDDDHLLRHKLDRLLADLRDGRPDLIVDIHDAFETADLPDLRTVSLFGDERVVVLRGAEKLKAGLAGQVEDHLESLDHASATLVLVVRGSAAGKLARAAQEHGEVVEASSPAPWKHDQWLRLVEYELRLLGRPAQPAAVQALYDAAGQDPSTIASKVSQVVAATPGDGPLTLQDVEATVEGHGNLGGMALADAVEQRDPAAALVTLRGAIESGEHPLPLLAVVTNRVRQLLAVRGGHDAASAGVSPGRHRMLQQAARRFNPGELAWIHDRLAQADLDLKGSDLPDDVILELAIIDAASAREVGAPWIPAVPA
ncbi:MAG TPA: DNA polymerase III subunit delta [Nitriliruptorales bacterium]